MDSKVSAQQRADQIHAFNNELAMLAQDGVLQLDAAQQQAVNAHHEQIIAGLSQLFDIDTDQSDKQLTLGMRIASFLGALAFSASLFFLFYQYWGLLPMVPQTLLLVAFPLVGLGITWWCLKKEKTGYFAKIAGLITIACFVLNLSMLGAIHNIAASPNAFIVWSLLSVGLAYKTHSRLLLAFAILFFAAFLSARMGTWMGFYWLSFGDKPENFFLPAAVIFGLGHIKHTHFETFQPVYRVFGALLILIPVLILSNWGPSSYLTFDHDITEGLYQVVGFALSAGLIAYGVRRQWRESMNTGTVFFTIFLYTKFYDWWWDWFPKYLFFLVIALSSLLILMIFKRLRTKGSTSLQGGLRDEQA